jgi:hypothetical protein
MPSGDSTPIPADHNPTIVSQFPSFRLPVPTAPSESTSSGGSITPGGDIDWP